MLAQSAFGVPIVDARGRPPAPAACSPRPARPARRPATWLECAR